MLLAERLLLLDRQLDGSPWGAARSAAAQNRWLAAACLVELTALGRLSLTAGQVNVPEDISAHYALLNDAQAVLRKRSCTPTEAVEAVHRAMPRIAADLLASLVRRGILIEQSKRKFGLFKELSYPVQSTSAYRESVKMLEEGAEQIGLNDLWQLGMILLVDAFDLLKHHLPDQALALDARLDRFETFVSAARASNDPSAQRARLIFALSKFE